MMPTRCHSILISAAALALLIAATPAQDTPGRTNAAGCHNSKKQGYHCHGKKAATQAAPPAQGKASQPKRKTP